MVKIKMSLVLIGLIIFNLKILLPTLPLFGKSLRIKYIKAINVDNNVRKIMSEGWFPLIVGYITNNQNGMFIIIAVIIKSTKKAPILLLFIFPPNAP